MKAFIRSVKGSCQQETGPQASRLPVLVAGLGRIPSRKGVVAFAGTLRDCERELRSTLEDWVLVGLKLGHELSVLTGSSQTPVCRYLSDTGDGGGDFVFIRKKH